MGSRTRSLANFVGAGRGIVVFLSYRRDDTSGHAGRLRADIERDLPGSTVFMDISDISPGEDFAAAIKAAIVSCDALLALIGREWLHSLRQDGAEREQEDWARLEIKTALEHGIPIVPVLVDRASLPGARELPEDLAELARRQAIEISDGRWDYDVSRSIAVIKRRTRGSASRRQRRPYKLAAVVGVAVLVALLAASYVSRWRSADRPSGTWKPHSSTSMAASVSGGKPEPPAAGDAAQQVVVDYSQVETINVPHGFVVAAPSLFKFGIDVVKQTPPGSKVVLINNAEIYDGRAIHPTLSQNLLTQLFTENAPASFTLKFSQPLDSVDFVLPALFPATGSGVSFPAWSAHALGLEGQELSSQGEGIRRFLPRPPDAAGPREVPPRHYALRAPAFDGIAEVRFDSDPRLNGKPFAGFSAIVIEQLTLTRRRG